MQEKHLNLSRLHPAFIVFPLFAAPHLVVGARCFGGRSEELSLFLASVQIQQDPPGRAETGIINRDIWSRKSLVGPEPCCFQLSPDIKCSDMHPTALYTHSEALHCCFFLPLPGL